MHAESSFVELTSDSHRDVDTMDKVYASSTIHNKIRLSIIMGVKNTGFKNNFIVEHGRNRNK